MRCKVQLYVAGKVFYEEVQARDYQEAREVAIARNPNAKVMSVTGVFWWTFKMRSFWIQNQEIRMVM